MSKMLPLQQGKKTLSQKFREEEALTHLFPTSRFDYNAPRNIPISPVWYFNQRLLNFNQQFASYADYIYFPSLCTSRATYVY